MLVLLAAPAFAGTALAAQAPVGLGTAASFAVLSGSAVTNTGPSTINGDLGVSPGTAVTGFPPGIVNGTIHSADAVAAQAQADQTTAYNDAAGRTPVVNETGDLGGQTLTPGVYKSASSIGLTGTLTLDAQGDPNAVFIFQIGSTLTTASASRVNLINGAQPCNVYWQVGSSATLGTDSVFVGNILALTSISMNNDVTVAGRALAQTGAVTLIDDSITPSACTTATAPSAVTPTATTPATTAPPAAAPATTPPTATPVATTPVSIATPTKAAGTKAAGTNGAGTKAAGSNGAGTKAGGTKAGGTKGGGTKAGGTKTAIAPKPKNGTAVLAASDRRFGPAKCVSGNFRVRVTGHHIRRVIFSLGSQRVASSDKSPFGALIRAHSGVRTVTAHVTFTDATRAKTRQMKFRECAAVAAKAAVPKVSTPAPVKLKVKTPSAQPIKTSGFTG